MRAAGSLFVDLREAVRAEARRLFRFRGLLRSQPVGEFDDHKDSPGLDEKVDDGVNEGAVGDDGDILRLRLGERRRVAAREADEKI